MLIQMHSVSSTTFVPCPNCHMALEVGSDAPGSRLECEQCLVSLKVFEDDCGVMQLNVVGRPLMEVTAPCDSCGAEVSHQER